MRFLQGCQFFLLFLSVITQSQAMDPKPSLKTVAVFCGADDKVGEGVKELARNVGEKLAKRGYALITGGSKTGLMLEVNNGFASQGKPENMQGILPAIFKASNVEHPSLLEQNLHWTETVSNRLDRFREISDAVIVLPGGFGTLHELMDVIVHQQFKIIDKPIILLNFNGFWDGLLMQFRDMVDRKFLALHHLELLRVATTAEEAVDLLSKEQPITKGLEDRYWEK